MKNRARCTTMALAACACLLPAPSRAADAGADTIVRRAAHACFTSLIHASGYLVPRRTAVVMFPVAGYRITAVQAKVGDTVRRGDVVARARALATGTPKDDTAKDTPDVPLTSPASGVVLQGTAFVGMAMSLAAKPLFTLAVDGEIEAAVDVPSVHIIELQVGQVAHLTMHDGSVRDGRVRRMPVEIDPASQMGSTRLSINDGKAPQPGLEPSRFVRATIEARRSCGIGVPMAALRHTSAGSNVQVVENGVIHDRPVTLGLADATDSEVTSGLKEGDLVVVGAGSSRDGDRVTSIFADPRDAR